MHFPEGLEDSPLKNLYKIILTAVIKLNIHIHDETKLEKFYMLSHLNTSFDANTQLTSEIFIMCTLLFCFSGIFLTSLEVRGHGSSLKSRPL